MRTRAGALTDDDVELEILHRGIEDLFDVRLQAMNLVDEQDVAEFQIREDRGQVAFELDQRAGGCPKVSPHFVRDDRGQGCLAEPRRAIEQDVIERLAPSSRSLNGNIEIVFDALLPDVLRQDPRPQRQLKRHLLFDHRARYDAFRHIVSFLDAG